MTLTPPFAGRCLCGATTWLARAAPLWQAHCHCDSCRRATGAPVASYLGLREGLWAWTGAPPASYQSSPGVWRDRCATCGAPMAYRAARFPGETHLLAATLLAPQDFAPTVHVHAAEALAWLPLADGLPRKAGPG